MWIGGNRSFVTKPSPAGTTGGPPKLETETVMSGDNALTNGIFIDQVHEKSAQQLPDADTIP